MATYDLTQAELSGVISGNLDASVRDFVLNYLFDDENSPGNSAFGHAQGMGHNNPPDDTIKVQISQGFQELDKKAEALVLNNEHGVVETGGKLEAIIQNVSGDSDLRVTGNQDVLVATGTGDNFVDMQNTGDDIVLTGSGQDTVFDGAGNDTILAGDGNDRSPVATATSSCSTARPATTRSSAATATSTRCRAATVVTSCSAAMATTSSSRAATRTTSSSAATATATC